ncbi:hypothetical protein [Streptomyces sp. NPDC101178]|uniref:hypothetical protein n=1 Tax=Streptomyces sp. NPDC101178 TaxID=3366124 RepID=UPI00381C5E42
MRAAAASRTGVVGGGIGGCAAMGQDDVDVSFRGVPAGTRHYLYAQPGVGVTA